MTEYEDYLELLEFVERGASCEAPLSDKKEKELENQNLDCLSRGDRSVTMLRTVKSKPFVESDFFSLFDEDHFYSLSTDYGRYSYLVDRVKNHIRGIFKRYLSGSCSREELLAKFPFLNFQDVENEQEVKDFAKALLKKSPEKIESVMLTPITNQPKQAYLTDISVPARMNMRAYHYRRSPRKEYAFCDPGNAFAELYIANEVRKKIAECYASGDSDDAVVNAVDCLLSKAINESLRKVSVYGMINISPAIQALLAKGDTLTYLSEFLADYGLSSVSDSNENNCLDWTTLGLLWLRYGKPEEIPFYMAFSRETGYCCSFKGHCCYLIAAFNLFYVRYISDAEEDRVEKRLAKERATVWMDLKNIPEKYRAASRNSKFNEFFSYVEFDPNIELLNGEAACVTTDNKKFSIVEEFLPLAKTLGFDKCNAALRFRKLGNYRASGLYFKALDTVCIDVRAPGSFIHEYFHMLDAINNDASKASRFYNVYNNYSYLIRNKVSNDKNLKESLKGKYNLAYYLRNTEVFARCAEIYVSRICGMSNCLISNVSCESFAYPHDDKLEELIREYFDEFLRFDSAAFSERLKARNDPAAV